MADIATNLQSGLLKRLGVNPSTDGGLRRWLIDGAYVPEVNTSTDAIELTNIEVTRDLVPYLSFDFERFALASAETLLIAKLEHTKHKLASWPLLKLYYSAFFAAHAIMRSHGTGVLKIDKDHVKEINNLLDSVGNGNKKFAPGMYNYKLELSTRSSPYMTFSKPKVGRGTHDEFWKIFCKFLDDRANFSLLTGAVDARKLVSGVEEIKMAVSGSNIGSVSSISAMRNDINYQHKYAVWYPIRRSNRLGNLIEDLEVKASKNVVFGSSLRSKPIRPFVEVLHYLACLNVDISEFVAARSTKGGAFGQKWRRLRAELG